MLTLCSAAMPFCGGSCSPLDVRAALRRQDAYLHATASPVRAVSSGHDAQISTVGLMPAAAGQPASHRGQNRDMLLAVADLVT